MPKTNIPEIVFPVASLGDEHKPFLQIWGTAFCIGEGFYLTAAHVMESASGSVENQISDALTIGLGIANSGGWLFSTDTKYEIHPQLDLAIIENHHHFNSSRDSVVPAWNLEQLLVLNDVYTLGYPYAKFEKDDLTSITPRGFKGHIIGLRDHGLMTGPDFGAYELSFQTPRGLSGAPLFSRGPDHCVCGLIIANEMKEMTVSRWEDINEDGQRSTHIQSEVMNIGIAIQEAEIFNAPFELMNGTIGGHLSELGLLK